MNRIAKITQKKLDNKLINEALSCSDFNGRLYTRCKQEVNNFFPGINLGIPIQGKKEIYSIFISKNQLTNFIFEIALEQVKNHI